MNYCHNDFIYYSTSEYCEIIDYIGKEKLIFIPDIYNGLPIKQVHLDAFKKDSKKVVILGNNIEVIHPFTLKVDDEIVFYQPLGSHQIFDLPFMVVRKELIKITRDDIFYYAILSDNTAIVIHSAILDFRFEPLGRFGEKIVIEKMIDGHKIVGIENYALMDVINLYAISIPATISWIGRKCFFNTEMLEEIYLPESVQHVGNQALAHCLNLKCVYMMNDEIELEDGVFENSYRAMLYFGSSKRYMKITTDFNPDLLPIALGYEKNIMFDDVEYALLNDRTAIVNGLSASDFIHLNIPDEVNGYKVVEIAPFAFYQEKYLQSVKIPDSITAIHTSAFAESHIKKAKLSNALRVIDDGIFSGCLYLKSIEIHEGVEIIQEGAFSRCVSLSQVKLPTSLVIINNSSFFGCYRLRNVIFPDGLEEIMPYAFFETNLKEIILPSTLTGIGEMSFGNLSKISKLTIGNALIDIHEDAFLGSKIVNCQIEGEDIERFEEWRDQQGEKNS
ncbi:MAG: leucine-rich repeat domain-containing protein [Acholeplasma sp.]|jgi:hypothetical protein|nr:MAG: leucine-rich repeat domain-containing protein [Acholeplasma sp.]